MSRRNPRGSIKAQLRDLSLLRVACEGDQAQTSSAKSRATHFQVNPECTSPAVVKAEGHEVVQFMDDGLGAAHIVPRIVQVRFRFFFCFSYFLKKSTIHAFIWKIC